MKLKNIIDNLNEKKEKLSKNDLDIDSDDLKAQVEMKRLESYRYKSDTVDRKWLAIWTAGVVTLWLIAVIGILLYNKSQSIGLSDTVLVTLLGTTTLNVLGLSFIVLRGHFTSSQKTG